MNSSQCITRIGMQSGSFIKLIADAYKVEEKTVIVYARFLREAGLLTSGARGANAPHRRPLDAARMTIALLATDKPSQAVAAVSRFAAMTLRRDECRGELPQILFHGAPSLEQALVRLFGNNPGCGVFNGAPYFEIHESNKKRSFRLAAVIFRSEPHPGQPKWPSRTGVSCSESAARADWLPSN